MLNKLLKKYDSISKPTKASLWFMFASIVNKGIAFLSTPLFTRLLTQDEYGVISLYNTWLVLLTIIVTLNLATGVYNKAMIKFEDDRDGYTSSSLFLTTLLLVFFVMIYCFNTRFWNKLFGLNTGIMLLLFAEIFSTTAWDFYLIRNRFEFRYKLIVFVTISANLLSTILSGILVVAIPDGRVYARIAGIVSVHLAVYSFFYFRTLKKGKVLFRWEYWKYSLAYNLPLVPHYLSQQVLNQSDRIMISAICGNAAAGIYSLAYQLAVVMQIITNAIHASFMPWCFQNIKSGNLKSIGKRAFQIELIIGVICIVFSLFAPELIWILGGDSYYNAVYIVPPVAISILFLTIYSFFANIEFYYEKTKVVMLASCIVAILNVSLNYFFIPLFGFVAAGYTTLICYIGYALIHYISMIRICKENNIENPFPGGRMWIVAIIFAIISVLISCVYKSGIIRYVIAITCMVFIVLYILKNKPSFLGRD